MEFLSNAWAWWQGNEVMILVILGAILTIALAIPGEHPDKEIKWVVNLILKFSKKPKK